MTQWKTPKNAVAEIRGLRELQQFITTTTWGFGLVAETRSPMD